MFVTEHTPVLGHWWKKKRWLSWKRSAVDQHLPGFGSGSSGPARSEITLKGKGRHLPPKHSCVGHPLSTSFTQHLFIGHPTHARCWGYRLSPQGLAPSLKEKSVT